MNRNKVYMLRGIGIGFILAAVLFFLVDSFNEPVEPVELTKEEIMSRAAEYGMVKVTNLDQVYLTDEEVIEKAKQLGMDFVEK